MIIQNTGKFTVAIFVIAVFVLAVGVASAVDRYVGPGETYTTIQSAEDAAGSYDTIIVRDGTYPENVDVDVAHLTIRSENGSANCTVTANDPNDHVFEVTADYVNITGFTVTGAFVQHAILLYPADHCTISENTLSNNYNGIYLFSSNNNTIVNNIVSNNSYGIRVEGPGGSSTYNNLTDNTVSNNNYGIALGAFCNYNSLTGNTISNNTYGITLSASSNNTITCNWVHNNTQYGFFVISAAAGPSTGNTIASNNIMFNSLYNFFNMQSTTMEAKNNYWFATTNETIDPTIYDDEESSGAAGAVTFYPFETRPVPCAPGPLLGVTKTVWNGTAWVKEVKDAHINDTVRFNCTITNIGTVNLSQVRFWDILDCSLVFAGNATLTNATGVVVNDSIVLEGNDNYTFKPKILHPVYTPIWNPYDPSQEVFGELCPDSGIEYMLPLFGWEDTNNDNRISACDQISLIEGQNKSWYHVDHVPYTLNITNNETGESMYLESLYEDYEEVDLSLPEENTVWQEVGWTEACCGGDWYGGIGEWNDIDEDGNLSVNDTILLMDLDDWYTVMEIAIDLVVSREWEVDAFVDPDGLVLAPGQSLTLEYNATDISCGYDENTFVAKGLYDGKWTYSNEDVAVVEVPPRPAVETNLTVWNGTAWAKAITVLVNETLNFSWLVHNNGTCCDLVNIEGTLTFGSSETTVDTIEDLVPCSEANGTLEVPALECGTYIVWWNMSADCSETYETVTAEDTVTVTVACPELEVNKTVWNGTAWVKALDANIGDTVRFNCTITNTGNVNLSEIRFWDILDCSLNFSGNETLDLSGEDVDISLDGTYIFKPRVLHPDNLSWDPYKPQPYEWFAELCPNNETWYLQEWEDTNNDTRVSACDQIFFEGVALWCHVENVPYTLLVNNTATNTSMYIDSALDYESLNLSMPTGTEWLGVCCCKDRYNLTAWSDTNSSGDLNVNDTLVLQNLRTGEVAQYTVEEVTIDLVVSREWELNTLHYPDPVIFEPTQSITIEYNATVIRCGVDNNTFRAKGNYSNVWTYSNEDKVTVTVPCPGGYASDSGGSEQEVYYTDQTVYATGSGFAPNSEVDIYITEDKHWVDGTPINSTIYAQKHNVTTDGNGSIIGEEIWPNPDPGEYDIVYDTNNNMKFDLGVDAVDNENDPGFIVLERERVPTLTPVGIAALIGLLSVIAISTIERKKRR
ncbi:MAG: right-handed parallel beta-helix repeat-containing protein [Methanomicrobia archaeon]|nr:right-handed parallel beta-helix repeat-containing protein [Methanomicrobia archaeon]